jgi:sulfide:quinone oxidoreductase
MAESGSAAEVLVVGGGVAALETLMALRELAGDRVRATLVAPEPDFVFRPLAVAEPFGLGEARRYPLRRIAADVGAGLVRAGLAALDVPARRIVLRSGDTLAYDSVVLSPGARVLPAFDGVLTFAGPGSAPAMRELLDELDAGVVRRIAFVAPTVVGWTLPLYELALLTAQRTAATAPRLTLVTPEQAPLAIFGQQAARATAGLLARAGIELQLGTYASVDAPGWIALRPHEHVLEADHIVALARTAGRAPEGVPADAEGFVAVDDHGRVREAEAIYAVGDVTTFPIKQGGLACQLADVVATQLAAAAGADVEPRTFRPVLRGQLLAGARTLHLDSPIAGGSGGGMANVSSIWRPSHKIDAPYLSRMLEDEPGFGIPPVGVDVAIRLASPSELEREPLALDPYSPLLDRSRVAR